MAGILENSAYKIFEAACKVLEETKKLSPESLSPELTQALKELDEATDSVDEDMSAC